METGKERYSVAFPPAQIKLQLDLGFLFTCNLQLLIFMCTHIKITLFKQTESSTMNNEKLIEYRKRAEAKRVIKKVSFNQETEKDILEIANNIDFSQWVKQQLRKEFNK